ncbi:hypothetical protein [Pseudoduganella armeniaca]|uniref:hypothetical protein n=1 Tax=Pseudoduganella armeniaca TaxID=2072590 RepID=UPI0015E6356C|nr:hypothetical protein [Pseudoduganella armeniaca]
MTLRIPLLIVLALAGHLCGPGAAAQVAGDPTLPPPSLAARPPPRPRRAGPRCPNCSRSSSRARQAGAASP